MAKRYWTRRLKCAREGCAGYAHYEYPTQRDMIDAAKRAPAEWFCSRHEREHEILSLDRLTTTFEVVSTQQPTGNYWGHRGFMHGPGFRTWCDDFPPGTILRVTAQIELPDGTTLPGREAG